MSCHFIKSQCQFERTLYNSKPAPTRLLDLMLFDSSLDNIVFKRQRLRSFSLLAASYSSTS